MIAPRPAVSATPLAVHGGRRALHGEGTAVRHDFSTCVNAFGPADVVRDAMSRASPDEYPDPHARTARRAVAQRYGCTVDEIAVAAGTMELIQAACLAYLRPGDHVMIAAPAFGEYARMARLCDAQPHAVGPLDPEEPALDVEAFCRTIGELRPRLAFVCTPANPTGRALGAEAVRAIGDACNAVDGLLVLDQAYAAFSDRPLGTPACPGHPAILHLRSLTKDHALAGVRVGLAVGPPAVIDALERVRVPWSPSAAALAACAAAMTAAADAHVARTIAILRAERCRLTNACAALGLEPLSTAAHFFVARVGDAAAFRAALLGDAGIAVRDCSSFGLPQWVRIAARTPAENETLLEALRLRALDPFRLASLPSIARSLP